MNHCRRFLDETAEIASILKAKDIEAMVQELVKLRERQGRLFVLGLGGSAANASHAVNDFRKLCGIEAYAPTDNVAELTAIANDFGWSEIFSKWLRESNLTVKDALLILSVGGGSSNVSLPLIDAQAVGPQRRVLGIVGRDGGYTARNGHCVVIVPTINNLHITPHTESFQSVILHCIVSHPYLQRNKTKW